jgi:hypothetical protein
MILLLVGALAVTRPTAGPLPVVSLAHFVKTVGVYVWCGCVVSVVCGVW